MADSAESPQSGGTAETHGYGMFGYTALALPEQKTFGKLYGTLTAAQRTWRCEQMKKSADLMEKAWELLRPISEGHWDREKAYMGQALFIKAIYEGQGYPSIPMELASQLWPLMRIVEEHVPYVNHGGRRARGEENPARYALCTAFKCIGVVSILTMTVGVDDPKVDMAKNEVAEAETLQMAVRCLDMLGGPLCHEGTLTAEEKGYLARLATAAGSDIGALIAATPLHVLAIYMLQVQYDIDLRIVKWVLHYVAARCCKEAYARVRTGAPGSSRGSPAGIAARSAWLSHSAALGKLDPGCPLAAYMVAEARGSTEGSHPETLAVMRAAAATAERRGDDLIAWLARLNVAYTIIHGGCGDTFSEDEVMQELDAANAQKVSLRRWGGAVILEPRCKALKESLMKALQASREQKQKQLAEAAAAAAAAASSSSSAAAAVVDDGRLPTFILRQDQWAVLTPVPVPHRQCAGCKKLFHKAMACGKCKQVWYCGRDCQLAHWKAGHKKECAELAARAAETAAAAAAGPEDVD